MYVCLCKGITDAQIQRELEKPDVSPGSIIKALGLDLDCCGMCSENITDLINVSENSTSLQPLSKEGINAENYEL